SRQSLPNAEVLPESAKHLFVQDPVWKIGCMAGGESPLAILKYRSRTALDSVAHHRGSSNGSTTLRCRIATAAGAQCVSQSLLERASRLGGTCIHNERHRGRPFAGLIPWSVSDENHARK